MVIFRKSVPESQDYIAVTLYDRINSSIDARSQRYCYLGKEIL